MNTKFITMSILTAAILVGCGGGGGGSSSSSTSTTKSISGIVSDPEIKEAQVQLCEKTDLTTCLNVSDTTNENGEYSLSVDKNLNLQDYIIIAKNGIDTKTGMDFSGFTFKAPANLPTDENKLIISPLTTMIANKVENGDTLEEALSKTSTNLGLSKDKLKMNPTKDKDLQKIALVISSIKKLTNKKFTEINIQNGDINTYIDSISSDTQKNQLKTTLELMNEKDEDNKDINTKQMIKRFTSFQELLQTEEISAFNKTDMNVFKNIKKAAKKVAKALKNKENVSLNQIRKVISLVDKTDYTNENKIIADIDTTNIDLDNNDSKIVDIKNELNTPISDVDKLREYYYSSNISYINQAEQIVKNVSDIATTDTIYLGIAKTYLANNDVKKAKDYLNNKIFKTSTKNKLKLAMANRLVIQNTLESKTEAKKLYDEVFTYIKKIYKDKIIDANAVINISLLLEGYTKLNETTELNSLTTYLADKKSKVTRRYGILNSLKKVAEDKIAAGESKEEVEKIIDLHFDWAKDLPESRGTLFIRMVYISFSADLYTKIQSYEKATKIADILLDTQKNTPSKTRENYTIDAVKYYVNAKKYAKVEEVVNSISDSSIKAQGYRAYAVVKYVNEGYAKALEFINANITDSKVKRTALTHYTNSITSIAIKNKNTAEAKLALAEASKLLNEELKNATYGADEKANPLLFSANYIQLGYIRYAKFYDELNESVLRDSMITKAEEFFTKFNGYEFVQAYTNLINEYLKRGDTAQAKNAFDNAINNYVPTAKSLVAKINANNYLVSFDYKSNIEGLIPQIDASFNLLQLNEDIGASYGSKWRPDTGPEGQKKKRVDLFIELAEYYNKYKKKESVEKSLDAAVKVANTLAKTQDKYTFLTKLVKEYSKYAFVQKAINLANSFEYRYDKRKALSLVSQEIIRYDAFPSIKGATIDHDNDGKLDFYDYGYGSLTVNIPLDDDLDNDGILNDADTTPYYKAK